MVILVFGILVFFIVWCICMLYMFLFLKLGSKVGCMFIMCFWYVWIRYVGINYKNLANIMKVIFDVVSCFSIVFDW